MKLIVGLGNPGKEYENTRHNVGFMVLDCYAKEKNLSFSKKKFNGIYAEEIKNGEKIIYLKPQSFMNLSGEVVGEFVTFFKIPIEDVFIIHDDMDIPLGKYKLKPQGSSGGHNGLKNIELHLHSSKYARLKIGISKNKEMDVKDYVLGHFSQEEISLLHPVICKAKEIVDAFPTMSFDHLMNKYNSLL